MLTESDFFFLGIFMGFYTAKIVDSFLTGKVERIQAKIKLLEEKRLTIKSFSFCDEKVLLEKIDSEIKMLREKLFILFLK